MTKKWNLQDIQPANRPRRAPKRMARANGEPAPKSVERRPAPTETEAQEEGTSIDIHAASPAAAAKERTYAEPPRRMTRRPSLGTKPEPEIPEEHFDTIEIVDGRTSKRNKLYLAIAVFLAIVIGGVIASALTGGAEVIVHPRYTDKFVNANYNGSPTPQENTITYELLTLEADGEKQVKASGQEEVTQQSEGTILIYNEFSTSPVRLVKNTRFETADGLIFKIKESAVVPGYSEEDGKIIPGVLAADVFAETAGDKYNVGPTTFTIPGFKGYPEFDKVYAESTSNMKGGFSGKKFIIDENELETSRQALHTELRDALLEKLKAQAPAGFVLYDNAVTISFESMPSVAYGDDLATIKEKGVLRIPLFKEGDFAAFLAKQSVDGFEGLPVRLADYHSLEFSYTSPTTTVSDISGIQELGFNLKGDIQIIWEFDENALKADMLGREKTALQGILEKYPAIDEAYTEVRPFWKTSLPREMKEIEVVEMLKE